MSSTRKSYQDGSIERVRRANGPDVWVYRYRVTNDENKRVQRKRVVGSVNEYPTKAAAKKAVENRRAEINSQPKVGDLTFLELWGHFQKHELHDKEIDRSPTTITVYLDNFRLYILPKWAPIPISEIKAWKVEAWLRSLEHADGTKSKLRNQMSALFSHAIRHDLFTGQNPIATVRQSAEPELDAVILSLDDMKRLLSEIDSKATKMMILIAASTGLRKSEIRGLKWKDLDWDGLWLNLKRGVVRKHLTKLKTKASRKGIPITGALAAALIQFREESAYRADEDWVFASVTVNGRSPLWLDTVLKKQIRPMLHLAGIEKVDGWHTFRRSFASLLSSKVDDLKITQELMRHANISTTMNLYAQASKARKREAQEHTNEIFSLPKAS